MMAMEGICGTRWIVMGAMTLVWLLVPAALILGVLALLKSLRKEWRASLYHPSDQRNRRTSSVVTAGAELPHADRT